MLFAEYSVHIYNEREIFGTHTSKLDQIKAVATFICDLHIKHITNSKWKFPDWSA